MIYNKNQSYSRIVRVKSIKANWKLYIKIRIRMLKSLLPDSDQVGKSEKQDWQKTVEGVMWWRSGLFTDKYSDECNENSEEQRNPTFLTNMF